MTSKYSIGYAFRQLDAAIDHADVVWGKLDCDNAKTPGTVSYHARAVIEYMKEALEVLRCQIPNTWQLCPYNDCCWGCGCEHEGIYKCPHCGKLFKCEYSDSDVEDLKLTRIEHPLVNAHVDLAFDFGPTWASKENK